MAETVPSKESSLSNLLQLLDKIFGFFGLMALLLLIPLIYKQSRTFDDVYGGSSLPIKK